MIMHDWWVERGLRCPERVQDRLETLLISVFIHRPDAKAIEILKSVASAMKPGYSKLIINDVVLPPQGATRFAVQSDLTMMGFFSAMERNEAQWRRLLEAAGFEILKFWLAFPESVIEAQLKTK